MQSSESVKEIPAKTKFSVIPAHLTSAQTLLMRGQIREIERLQEQVAWLHRDSQKFREEYSRYEFIVNQCNNCDLSFDLKQYSCPECGSTNIYGTSYNQDDILELINKNSDLKKQISLLTTKLANLNKSLE